MEKATRKPGQRETDWKELLAGQQDLLRQLVQRRRGVMAAEMEDAVVAEKGREDGVIRSEAGVMAMDADREGRRKLLAGELFGANSRAVGRIFELPSLPSVAAAVLLLGEPLGPLNQSQDRNLQPMHARGRNSSGQVGAGEAACSTPRSHSRLSDALRNPD